MKPPLAPTWWIPPAPPQVVTFVLYIKQAYHFTASLFSKLCLLHLLHRTPSQKQKRVAHVGLALGLFCKPSPGLFSVTLTHLTDGQRSTIYAGRVWRRLRWRGARLHTQVFKMSAAVGYATMFGPEKRATCSFFFCHVRLEESDFCYLMSQ